MKKQSNKQGYSIKTDYEISKTYKVLSCLKHEPRTTYFLPEDLNQTPKLLVASKSARIPEIKSKLPQLTLVDQFDIYEIFYIKLISKLLKALLSLWELI